MARQCEVTASASLSVCLNILVSRKGLEMNNQLILIGMGKFSVVFKAERTSDKLLVALKLIKIFDMSDVKQRDKCLKEVKLLQVS